MLPGKPASPLLVFAFTIALAGSAPAYAEQINLRIAFEDVQGAEELESGDFDRGISITSTQLEQEDAAYRGRLLTNLCGAYVASRALSKARQTCELAVRSEQSPAAYNNRGVLRTLTGDLDGARRDFARLRPDDFDVYLERIMQRDARFMASENLDLLDEVEARIAAITEGRERLSLDLPVEKL
jgi:hypothetical protein